MTAYYNEHDPKAAAWLRELIERGHIAPGVVDERSIEGVSANDLAGFVQCHFFAGIGVWSYALRLAGWPDDRPVWTGSCPCQPFSAAGKGKGTADERHLWPAWFWLVDQCRPDVVFGEQVSSKDGLGWLDLVSADLEGAGYAIGALDSCAAGVGAPHIRHRLYFGAARRRAERRRPSETRDGQCQIKRPDGFRDARGMVDSLGQRLERHARNGGDGHEPGRVGAVAARSTATAGRAGRMEHDAGDGRVERRPEPGWRCASTGCGVGGLADNNDAQRRADGAGGHVSDGARTRRTEISDHARSGRAASNWSAPGPTNGFWRDADWLRCRDDRWRPVEPGTFPLAHGAAARVGRLRGYGNGLVAPHAATFIAAFEEARRQGGVI